MDRGSFVGRQHHLAALADARTSAYSGHPQVVFVGGEAGVGKTRLLEHFAEQTAAGGVLVLRGDCVDLGAEGLPLAPATAVLRGLVEVHGTTQALVSMLPGAEALLSLLPEYGVPESGPGSQARLFELFAALLRRVAAERPLLLMIDDFHWADRTTRNLLGMLARTLRSSPVLVVVAYRSDDVTRRHPLRPFLAELQRLPGVRRLHLDRFSRAETAELVADVLGHPPPQDQLEQIYRRTAGNALFATELARMPVGDALPESLRDLLVDRVERLGPPAAQVVRMLAVGGEHVPHPLLATVADLPEAQLLEAVRAAAEAGVVQPDQQGYAFRHRLLREAVVEDLLPAERAAATAHRLRLFTPDAKR